MLERVLDRAAELVLADERVRSYSMKVGGASLILVFSLAFLVFFFTEADPWVVLGKSVALGLLGFFAGLYGTLFAVARAENGADQGEGEAGRGASALGVQDSAEDEAEGAQ